MDKSAELLMPIAQMCISCIAQSRAASKISDSDLMLVRNALDTVVIPSSVTEPLSHPDHW